MLSELPHSKVVPPRIALFLRLRTRRVVLRTLAARSVTESFVALVALGLTMWWDQQKQQRTERQLDRTVLT